VAEHRTQDIYPDGREDEEGAKVGNRKPAEKLVQKGKRSVT
jgi:hypothetical protein